MTSALAGACELTHAVQRAGAFRDARAPLPDGGLVRDDARAVGDDAAATGDGVAVESPDGAADDAGPVVDAGDDDALPTAAFHTVPADTVTLDWHGSWTIDSGSVDCSDDEVAVGLVGRAGGDLAAIGLRCARVMPDGALSAARTVGPRGGGGAPDFADECPAGQALVRWAGAAGVVITRIAGTCAPLAAWLAAGTLGATLPSHGTGGTDFTDTCPAGYVARGLDLHTGLWDNFQTRVFGLRLRCVRVAPM